ncbi:MAG: phytanoyl-CoA dioxygenase family protein [Planctomycetes bacterium]|nr:phytanoyl-CoA dioxygenase family protein [Planctomycetota bacterium]
MTATATTVTPSPVTPRPWTAKPIDRQYLLSDEQVAKFVVHGYMLVTPEHRAGVNETIDAQLSAMTRNPGNDILDEVPLLYEVYNHPMVRGALASLLGHDVAMHEHRHWHNRGPGPWSQGWHQDSTNERHHQVRVVLGLYYPHDVTPEMGPTVILPGSHFRNCPTDRMATYGNIRGQVPVTVKAGTVAITHYDIWHGGSINRSSRVRHMLKFLFNRTSEPTGPAWNHDPVKGPAIASEYFGHWSPNTGQSDSYKERGLRAECWNHLMGKTKAPVETKASSGGY